MGNPWLGGGGGGGSKTKGKKQDKGFLANLGRNVREFVSVAPKIPGSLLGEALEVGRSVGGGGPKIPGMLGAAAPVPLEQRAAKVLKAKGVGEKAIALADLPGAALFPGTYVAPRLLTKQGRGELAQNPLYTALDVLPYVNKASKLMTEGGALARAAEAEARTAGKVGRAEMIAREGLKPVPLARQALKAGEAVLERKYPILEGKTPTALLEKSGLGGMRLRNVAEAINTQSRALKQDFGHQVNALEQVRTDLGLTEDDIRRLTVKAESGIPNWKADLSREESAYLRAYDDTVESLRQRGLATGEFFEFNGETYSKGDWQLRRAANLYNRLKDKAVTVKAAEEAGTFKGKIGSAEYQARAAKVLKRAETIAKARPPARFIPTLQTEVKRVVADKINAGVPLSEGDFERILADLHPDMSRADYLRVVRGVNKTWQDMRNLGYDPQFVHHVGPEQAKALKNPRLVGPVIKTPSELKRRAWNMAPWIPDMAVGLSHQALGWLQRDHAVNLIEQLADHKYLLGESEVKQWAIDRAERGFGKGGDVGTRADWLIKNNYSQFDPDSIFPFSRAGVKPLKSGSYYIPKVLDSIMNKARPPDLSNLAKGAELGVKGFRLSILTLSPAYYLGNAVSGAVLMAGRVSPLAFRQAGEAWRLMRSGALPHDLSTGARMGAAEAADATLEFLAGRTVGRMLQETPSGLNRAGRFVGRKVTALQAVAETIDDMYKAMSYLEAKGKNIKRGFTPEAAHQLGVETAHKVLMSFDRMLPFERATIRAVMPFYSWWKFISGYVLSYPFDHPIRASIVSAFARREFADWQENLPERFMSFMWFGKQDQEGKRLGLSMSNYFPFMTVANNFTRAGILSHIDPRIQIALEQMGVDPMTYGSDLFPTLAYDPVTGRETTKPPPLGRGILKGLFPQVSSILELTKASEDTLRLKESNPYAFRRMILQSFGIPAPDRRNFATEIEKSQTAQERVAADQARKAARSGAGKSGGNPWLSQ